MLYQNYDYHTVKSPNMSTFNLSPRDNKPEFQIEPYIFSRILELSVIDENQSVYI